jgi:predicted DNA-binding protein (MmcQ/YjbR family)
MYEDSNPALKHLRKICLALPEAFEKEAWGECTFRVTGGSMFAMTDNNHHDSGRVAVWIKAPPMVQEILVNVDAKRFFVPPYVGPKGWIGVRLDYKVDWEELGELLADGYRMSAPKKLRARLEPSKDDKVLAGSARNQAPASKPSARRAIEPTASPKPRRAKTTRASKP